MALLVRIASAGDARDKPSSGFDIAPFALPGAAPGEFRFEEPRDIAQLIVRFHDAPPPRLAVHYLRHTWPQVRLESARDLEDPCGFGWMPIDDLFNSHWQEAAIEVSPAGANAVAVSFKGLSAEFPEMTPYDVAFRRTLGVKIGVSDARQIETVRILTTSPPTISRLRVELDSGEQTPGEHVSLRGYNASILETTALRGVRAAGTEVALLRAPERSFELSVLHMQPSHAYGNDDGHVTFCTDHDTFTISLSSLRREGPAWYAERGVYVAFADDPLRFASYRRGVAGQKTLNQRVTERREQTYAGASNGQPRPHAVSTNLGCKHNRQRFRLEANGDLVLHKWNLTSIPGPDTDHFKCEGDARFFFELERLAVLARHADVPPVLSYNIHARSGKIDVTQKSFAVPLDCPIAHEQLAAFAPVVALLRFRFENVGDEPATAELPISYSQRSARSQNAYAGDDQDDYLVPKSEREDLFVHDHLLFSGPPRERVLRARWEGTMAPEPQGNRLVFRQFLRPGAACELLLKVPFIALNTPDELAALESLNFERGYQEVAAFWTDQASRGAQLWCPEEHLTALHASHLSHVLVTDCAMPDGSGLVNTSVGTSTYGNFTNEACMVVHELDQRGLHEEARSRLELWIKYQGTARQPGNFTDYDGMYFGAGGFEQGDYNQHHGWALWCLGMHYFLTGDAAWLARVAPSLIAGCDWVFRQRLLTKNELPHSRSWERGFLPAGSLEDVTDYHYWLSTNAITWRGVDTVAEALEAVGHAEAGRIRRATDAYGADLKAGFETMRKHTPLVRLRDGRWVPHYPSRLYWRQRDVGWIREVLEGSVYLLISGLYDADGPQAKWILEDYQDNRYVKRPYSYPLADFEADWYDRGGFSIQPNLLAGLMPHLDRDEPEIFLWMFFNAWCACYREEINAMVEHPNPALGYSSAAHFKTSDESNAVSWLRSMFVYATDRLLHVGRAVPRDWFVAGEPLGTSGVSTRYGTVSVNYETSADRRKITATLDLQLRTQPSRTLVRFRHPEGLALRAVRLNGQPCERFDAGRNDVPIDGHTGRIVVEATF